MGKEALTNKQATCLMIMFIMGSTLVLGVATDAKQDVWIAIIIAILFALPIVTIYARILYLFPGENLFEIVESLFGKILGKLISLCFIWYAFHLGALVIRNFSEFINVAAMPETPVFIPLIFLVSLCIWGVKEGIEVLGKWAQFVLPLLFSIIFIVVLLSTTIIDIDNIRPIMHNNIKLILKSSFSAFTFPFAETVVFTMVMKYSGNNRNYYKIYVTSLMIGGMFVLIIGLRNILVMGAHFISQTNFPSYAVVSLMNIGDFLQRMEIMVSVVFIFAGFIKISICLLATCNGVVKVFNINQYKKIVAPIGLLMMNLSLIIYDNIMEMSQWAFKYYKYYALPFQVFLPLIVWIFAEVKNKKNTEQN